ncbi:MAG: SBBP repeat-containing protein [Planctomycetota bacterium]
MSRQTCSMLTVLSVSLILMQYSHAEGQTEEWSTLFGSSSIDYSRAAGVDSSGNVIVGGLTYGNMFPGSYNGGPRDPFVAKCDADGNVLWVVQDGTSSDDDIEGVAADSSDNVIAVGETDGDLGGGTNAGAKDAYVQKYDPDGNIVWTNLIGTPGTDLGTCVAVADDDSIIVSGQTYGDLAAPHAGGGDIFVARLFPDGSQQWIRQIGSDDYDSPAGVAVDIQGNVYVAGYSGGQMGAFNSGFIDIVLLKYSPNGDHLWTRQLGTPGYDYGFDVAVDSSGNAYVAGYTGGDLNGSNGGFDSVLVKYDPSGAIVWIQQDGTPDTDRANGVSIDGSYVYVAGYTKGNFGGANQGNNDAFISKYSTGGQLISVHQFGTPESDWVDEVVVPEPDKPVVIGDSWGDLGGTREGDNDVFLVKFDHPPVPVTVNDYQVERGQVIGGSSLIYLQLSDNLRMTIRRQTGLHRLGPMSLVFEGQLPIDTPSSLEFQIECRASHQRIYQTVQFYNWSNGTFETIGGNQLSTTEETHNFGLPANFLDYVEAGTGNVRTRVRWEPPPRAVIRNSWNVYIDSVFWQE